MKKKLFLSYAHKDSNKVIQVAQHLEKLGFDIWVDKHKIKGGDLWSGEIARAIETCDYYILFISNSSMRSDPVRREADLAYTNKRKMILVRLDDAKIPNQLAYQTSGIQWIDAREKHWMQQFQQALQTKTSVPEETLPADDHSNSEYEAKANGGISIQGNAIHSVIILGNKNKVRHG